MCDGRCECDSVDPATLIGQPGIIIKVFSATKFRDREVLGEKVTEWLRGNGLVGVHTWVRQSSDREFHCLSFTVLARAVAGE